MEVTFNIGFTVVYYDLCRHYTFVNNSICFIKNILRIIIYDTFFFRFDPPTDLHSRCRSCSFIKDEVLQIIDKKNLTQKELNDLSIQMVHDLVQN